MKLNTNDIQKVMVAMRQLGVSMSGGAEALAIFHQLLYDIWREGGMTRPIARIKIDEKNCFGRLEWGAIRRAVLESLPHHHAVASWKHHMVSHVEQQDAEATPKNRGAEQGDVDGPLECSLTLGGVATEARQEIHNAQANGLLPWACADPGQVSAALAAHGQIQAKSTEYTQRKPAERRQGSGRGVIDTDPRHAIQDNGGLADWWYLDDGDIICDPLLVMPYLECFDRANPKVGADRNRKKTEVIYYATEEEMRNHRETWQLGRVEREAAVSSAACGSLTLGVATGPSSSVDEQLQTKVRVVRAMQEKAAVCQDPQTEHVLCRQSLGIGRVNHILRVHGHELVQRRDKLEAFDDVTREVVDRLFPGLSAEGYEQATLTAVLGGIGWRRGTDTALPASLGAHTVAKPVVRWMAKAAEKAGLILPGQIETRFDEKLRRMKEDYVQGLDEVEKVKAEAFIHRAETAAEERWARTASGEHGPQTKAPRADLDYAGEDEADSGRQSVAEDNDGGDGDTEGTGRILSGPHLQKELSRLADCTRLRHLEAALRNQCNWAQLARLRELRHPAVSHKWLWHLDSSRGSVLSQADYVLNVQKRLGASIYNGGECCRLCGEPLDEELEHCEACAAAEATRGHYAVVRAMVEGLKVADPGVTTEPRGLTHTQARPADILTTAAVPGRSAALDVCVTSANATAAAGDAPEAAFKRKLRHYRSIIPCLTRMGIVYRPLVWSADGRPHPAVTRTMRFAAERAASHGGGVRAGDLLGRWKHEVMIAILRRRAAMARSVRPGASSWEDWLRTGHPTADPDAGGRLPLLEEEVEEGQGEQAADAEQEGAMEE